MTRPQPGAGAPESRRSRLTYQIADAQLAIDVASGKWVLPILELLTGGGLRRGQLRRMLGGDTHQKVLTLTLQRMVAAGLISRTILRVMPPAVLYELTDHGGTYLHLLAPLAGWAAADRDRLTAVLAGDAELPADDVDDTETSEMERSARQSIQPPGEGPASDPALDAGIALAPTTAAGHRRTTPPARCRTRRPSPTAAADLG